MQAPFKKLAFTVATASFFLCVLLVSGSAPPLDATAGTSPSVGPQALFPPVFGLSSAYFTGTYCYIDCDNGSFSTVTSFSTSSCCDACANFCGSGCVAEGGGPAVLCGAE